ncbi:36917_t:CDS:2, partial [Gigaspora margarita]
MRVLAIVRTKLKETALEIFDSEIGTINCYWRSDINGNQNIIDTLKDTTEYPTNLNHPYNGAFNPSATTEGERYFWNFDFTKGLDYNNDNGMRNLINKYKKLMQVANWQWGNNFFGGEYMFLLQRMPPIIMKHISSMNPKPANRNEFFIAADNQFLAVRLTMSLTGNLKEKVSHFKEKKTTKFNNVQTTEIAQKIEMPHTTWEKDNDLENQFQWYIIPEIIDSQKETITKGTIIKEETIRKEITIIGKTITTIEEDITT